MQIHGRLVGPWALKDPGPLAPAYDLADHGVFDLRRPDSLGERKAERRVESNDGEHVAMGTMTQGSSGAHVGLTAHVGDEVPVGGGSNPR